jgi:hypothetical protein
MMNLPSQSIFVHTSKGFLADGFTSPPKEGVLRIFIACKNLSPSAGIETANLSKHASHYTTKDDHL